MDSRLGKYQLKDLLGKGATGKVFRAIDTFSGEEVAVKVLDEQVVSDPEFNEECRKQFMNEAALTGKLAHPHIVEIREAAVDEKFGYVAMEYVPGGNLLRYTKPDDLLPLQDAIEIVFKCCGALDYAFRQGIIHRDIKPANIMVFEGTQVKIADFGAALFYRAKCTQAMNVATPSYISPEQIGGGPLGFYTDMYSLGVVVYELLTGRRPFVGENMLQLFDLISKAEPEPPSRLRDGVTEEMDAVVLRMLRKNPEDRYASWAEGALALAEIGKLGRHAQQVSDSEKFGSLRRMDTAGEFTDADIWELVHAGVWQRLPARAIIIREDAIGGSMFFLAQGEVKITKQERLLNALREGASFGEMAYIRRGSPRHATVESITEVLVAEFENGALERLSERCQSRFARTVLRTLTDSLALADERIVYMLG